MKTIIWQTGHGDGIFGAGDDLDAAIAVANDHLDAADRITHAVHHRSNTVHDGSVVYADVTDEVAEVADRGGWDFLRML